MKLIGQPGEVQIPEDFLRIPDMALARVSGRLPAWADTDSIRSAALVAVVKWVRDNGPVDFGLCYNKASWAALDELRASDHMTRRGRINFGKISKVSGWEKSDDIAEACGLSVLQVRRAVAEAKAMPVSGDEVLVGGGGTKTRMDSVTYEEPTRRGVDIDAVFGVFRKSVKKEARELHVLQMIYIQGMNQREVAEVLGVTFQAVNLVVLSAIRRIRRAMGKDPELVFKNEYQNQW